MPPIIVDPTWYEASWYNEPREAKRLRRTVGLISLALSSALLVGAFVVLRHLGLHGA